jgi:hypothetical protein
MTGIPMVKTERSGRRAEPSGHAMRLRLTPPLVGDLAATVLSEPTHLVVLVHEGTTWQYGSAAPTGTEMILTSVCCALTGTLQVGQPLDLGLPLGVGEDCR